MGKGNFARGFDLSPAFRMLTAYLLGKRSDKDNYDEWEKKERFKQQLKNEETDQQINALTKYQAGGETVLKEGQTPEILGKTPKTSNLNLKVSNPYQVEGATIPETKTSFRKYTPAEQIRLGLGGGLTPYRVTQDLEPPKQQDIYEGYLDKPHQRIGRNKYTGNVDVVEDYGQEFNPAYKFNWKEREIPNSLYKDSKTGQWFKRKGMYDYDADVWDNDEKGNVKVSNTTRIPITKSGTNGEKLFSKEIQKDFTEYQGNINKLLVGINSGIDPTTKLEATPEQIAGWKNDLATETTNYANEVKNTSSSRFKKFISEIYNSSEGGKKPKTNPLPLVYWNKGLKEASKYGFTDKDYQSLYNYFIATYKADPLKLYGIDGFEQYFDNEGSDDETNEEEM